MPTKEPLAPSIIPREEPKPIPVRVISTKPAKPVEEKPVAQIEAPQNGNQPIKVAQTAVVAESTKPEESVTLSGQLSAIARKEQAFRQREQAIKEREKAIAEKLEKADRFEQLQTKIKAKDFSELEGLGVSYDEYVAYLLQKQEGEDPRAKEISEIRGELSQMKREQEEQAEAQFEETKAAYKSEIGKMVAADPEFSSIKALGQKGEEAVLQLILDDWEEDNKETTVEEACKEIENHLVEQGKFFSSLPKLKPAPAPERQLPPPKTGTKTLTNDMMASGDAKPNVKLQNLSDSERYAEARRRVLARRQQQGQ